MVTIETIEKISNKIPIKKSFILNITILGILLFILYKIISFIYLKIKDDKTIESLSIKDDKTIESLSIKIKNLPLNTTYTTSYVNPQFNEYSAIVYYLKLNNVQNISYIADYDTQFIFLDELSDIKINNLIKLKSTYENNGIHIDCSIILSSTNVKILKNFINECVKNYDKYLLHKQNKCVKSIESLSIIIKNLPLETTKDTRKDNPQFKEYLAIVYYLKYKHIQNVSYIANYDGQFIFLNNLENVKINKLITFSSIYENNGSVIDCRISLSSVNVKIIRKFIDKCLKKYNKYIEKDHTFCDKTVKV